MKALPLSENEHLRLRAVRSYAILDTAPEPAFDEITQLAAHICGCPIATISLIEEDRQWYKSRVGVAKTETSRDISFCAHTILGNDPLVVPDARQDPRFADNPFVVGAPNIRFYAGLPLINCEGYALGTLCVVDTKPGNLTPEQGKALNSLRRHVVAHLELRRALIEQRQAEAEAEIQRLNSQLEQRVQDRTAELERANRFLHVEMAERERLQYQMVQTQKMEAIGRLAGGVAHDFNNILLVITGYCDLLLARKKEDDPESDFVREVQKAGQRGAALTRQLLAFSRRQIIEPKIFDLNTVLDQMVVMLQRLIGEDVCFSVNKGESLAPIRADVSQMEQVIMNLVINACDAMPQGGALTLETSSLCLKEPLKTLRGEIEPNDYTVLTVKDSGGGMSEDIKARLFEPFFTTKREGEGTGLGLATCYGIAKQNNGFITCETKLGNGTTFRVYFPAIAMKKAALKSGRLPRPAPRGREAILLVEDNPSVREMTALMLRDLGYTVHEAQDGIEALALVQSRSALQIDLLISDVVMPHMNGRELVAGLSKLRPQAPALLISGHTDDALIHHGVLNARTAFLQKPFSLQQLGERVREVLLDGTRAARDNAQCVGNAACEP